jgi:hypothetical protein
MSVIRNRYTLVQVNLLCSRWTIPKGKHVIVIVIYFKFEQIQIQVRKIKFHKPLDIECERILHKLLFVYLRQSKLFGLHELCF